MPLSFPCKFWHSHRLKNATLEAHAIKVILLLMRRVDQSLTFCMPKTSYVPTLAVSDMLSQRLSCKGTFQSVSCMLCDMPIMQNLCDSPNPFGSDLPLFPRCF